MWPILLPINLNQSQMKKVVILIDGQNLYYFLKNIGIVERQIKWTELFKSFLEPNDELVRAYWFRPQKIQDSHLTAEAIRNQVVYWDYKSSYDAYKKEDFNSIHPDILRKIEARAIEIELWITDKKSHFAEIDFHYDQLCLENGDIEIVKRGILKINPYKQKLTGEKGVDVALAVKMVSLSVEKKCDKIILVSGDYDYMEAITYVKNNMTKVHIVKLHTGYPPKNRNMSRDLSVLADRVIEVYENDLKTTYLK